MEISERGRFGNPYLEGLVSAVRGVEADEGRRGGGGRGGRGGPYGHASGGLGAPTGSEGPGGPSGSPEQVAREVYYFYLCQRRLRLLYLASAFDRKALAAYFEYAARALLDLMGSGEPGVGATRTHSVARASVSLDHHHEGSATSAGMVLGGSGTSHLGSAAALGTAVVETTAVVRGKVEVSQAEWGVLVRDRQALAAFKAACDLAVPLSMDLEIDFGIHSAEQTFRLPVSSCAVEEVEVGEVAGSVSEARYPVLGLSSTLGAS